MTTPHSLSEAQLLRLRDAALAAKKTAYCPYSSFHVGAALLLLPSPSSSSPSSSDDDKSVIVRGCNVENASYPVGMCAERVALGAAVAQGYRLGGTTEKEEGRMVVGALAVVTDAVPAASPCGMCRQAIREFCAGDVPVFMFDGNLDYVVMTVQEILPLSFGPEHLSTSRGMVADA